MCPLCTRYSTLSCSQPCDVCCCRCYNYTLSDTSWMIQGTGHRCYMYSSWGYTPTNTALEWSVPSLHRISSNLTLCSTLQGVAYCYCRDPTVQVRCPGTPLRKSCYWERSVGCGSGWWVWRPRMPPWPWSWASNSGRWNTDSTRLSCNCVPTQVTLQVPMTMRGTERVLYKRGDRDPQCECVLWHRRLNESITPTNGSITSKSY